MRQASRQAPKQEAPAAPRRASQGGGFFASLFGGGNKGPTTPYELEPVSGRNSKAVPLSGRVVLGRDRSEGATFIVQGDAVSGAHAQVGAPRNT